MKINLQNKKIYIGLLCAVLALGIFLRAYHFSDWLRFNADQGRDALVVREMIEKNEIPLLGQVAGGTDFRVGPISIYFQFLGAKIFSLAPDSMAYLELVFGILSIPVIFLLMTEYLKREISLMLALLYAVSFFAIQYSRFSWNPNSSQFFVPLLLYAGIKMANSDGTKKWMWSFIFAISIGVVVQLHTLLLFGVPLFFIIIAVYFLKNKQITLSHLFFIIAVAALMNAPQILSEIRTKGANFDAFYSAMNKKSSKQGSFFENVLHVGSCQLQSNVRILLPKNNQEECGFPLNEDSIRRLSKKGSSAAPFIASILEFILAVWLAAFGFLCLAKNIFNGDDERKKHFSVVVLAYLGAILLVSFPFGAEISLRYFIIGAFLPFLLLGILLDYLDKKVHSKKRNMVFVIVGSIFLLNIYFNATVFQKYAASPGNVIDGNMQQAQSMAEYMVEKSAPAKSFQVQGKVTELGRFANRVAFFAEEKSVSVIRMDIEIPFDASLPLFVVINEMSSSCEDGMETKYGYAKSCKRFGDAFILEIVNYKNQ